MRIDELIEHRARNTPERLFWQEPERGFTYAQIDADAGRVARALRAEGVRPGEHIAICAGNTYAYTCVHFGAAKAGVVLAHLNARYTAAELTALAAHSDARLLFFGPAQATRVAGARTDLPRVRRFVHLPPPPGRVVEETRTVPRWAEDFQTWLDAHGKGEPAVPSTVGAVSEDAPFQLLYTSGTTGFPKGVLISHGAKVRQGVTHALNLGLGEGDRVLSALPLYHQFAQWLVLVSVPLTGATVVARPAFDAGTYWQALRQESITHLPAVPTMLYRLLDPAYAAEPPPPALRCIVYGAAPIDPARIPELRQRFPGTRLFQGFGQTETGYCLGLHDTDHDQRPDSLGKPDVFGEVRLLDDAGQEVPVGQVGEIVARTPYLMSGYYKDPEATAAYFSCGPEWGRTGDLAWRDEAGYFVLAGRMDDLVISGGVNLYPAEVERVLLTHPDVADVAVVGLPDPDWGEALTSVVVLKPGREADASALAGHCRAVLADFKCPRRFFFWTELPRTPNGKVQKYRVQTLLTAEQGPHQARPQGS